MDRLLWIGVLAVLLWGCGRQQDTTVPRREAYPRIEQEEAVYEAVEGLPVNFAVNTAGCDTVAVEHRDDATWLTARYPKLGAKLYVTFTPVNENTIDQVVDNRLERMSLNFGNARVDADQLVSQTGYVCTVATTLSPVSTPIQFLALPPDGTGILVSGALFVDGSPLNREDITKIVTQDITYALNDL